MKHKNDSIAVIGLGCVYPGAHSPRELWENVLAGRRYFRVAPDVRIPREDYFDSNKYAPGKTYCDKMAVITDWEFDPLEFHIPPVSVYTSDISHWLSLYTAREALNDSGLNLDEIDRTKVGVIIGNTLTGEFSRSHNLMFRWPYVERSIRRALSGAEKNYVDSVVESIGNIYKAPLPEITEDSLPGNMSNTIAGRICNTFDFGGGCYTVDGACSSSLLSIAHACNSLLDDDMEIAVAGGVDISLDPFEVIGFAKTTALSAADIKPYDEHAEGLLPGEGCGIVLLAKESFAKKIGAKIHALIRGWGYSSDGSAGITAPEVEGQMRALKKAYDRAEYSISDVQLIEGHGTGTSLGDKVEINAIMRLLEQAGKNSTCKIGSIKSNIGHCKASAGVAAFIKTVMALKGKIIPPTTNCERPNASFGAPLTKLAPAFRGEEWEQSETPRRASVSAMGFGGANSHITIEESDGAVKANKEELEILRSARKTELIFLSAESEKKLIETIENILPVTAKICRAELTDLSAELAKNNPSGEIRLAIVAESPWDLHDKLTQILFQLKDSGEISNCDDSGSGIFAGKIKANPKFFALFPGQGSQRINMCRDLVAAFPFLENIYDEAGKNIREIIFHDVFAADKSTVKAWEEDLKKTGNSQPAIVLSSLAILKTLSFFGLNPDISIGHSLGEITALGSGGAYDEKAAIKIAVARGNAMASAKSDVPGAMLAIAANAVKVEKLLDDYKNILNIANYNSPVQTVVTGAADSIDKLASQCKTQKIRCTKLPVSNAFHSELVRPAAEELRKQLDKINFSKLSGKVISSSLGKKPDSKTNLKDLLAEQITSPVKFISAIEKAAEEDPDFWVEVGPGGVLTGLTRSILGRENVECFPTDLKGDDSLILLNKILARAFCAGLPVATKKLFTHRFSRPISIDNYDPVFIVNPCERPVDISAEVIESAREYLPQGILPDVEDKAKLENYLSERGEYIKEFIKRDFVDFTGGSIRSKPSRKIKKSSKKKVSDDSSEQNITDFAIDWIVQRTGFPKSSLSPEMKLRDDLNLDSIKVGELVFVICKKLKRKAPADPSAFANAQLDKLISMIQTDFQTEQEGQNGSDSDSSQSQTDISGIDDWVGTFQIEQLKMPLSDEAYLPFPKIGVALIVGNKNDPRVAAAEIRFERKGLDPVVVSPDSISKLKNLPKNFSVLILILPENNDPDTFDSNENDFDKKITQSAETLFNVFRWIGAGRDASWKHLRCLVARPCGNPENVDDSNDAGKAFMKTLRLEHPAAQAKWLTLPTEWSSDQWANVIEKEIQTTGCRVFYKYDTSGTRFTDVAKKLALSENGALKLSKNDVLLATGGAKGITFEMARGLALKTGAKLVLIGRSALPGNNEMIENFKILDNDGIVYKYFQCDVTNLQEMTKTVEEAEKIMGKISAVLHGAGISKLILLENMKPEDFLQTINIKVRGMYNLINSIPLKQLKAFHVISSVLGKTGMRGQTDYTFANAWIDGALSEIKNQYPKIHCASLGYSVWAETGLGQKLGAVKSLEASGVNAMSTKTGVDAYLTICNGACETSTFIITGRLGQQIENDIFAPLPTSRPRFTNRILRYAPGIELISEVTIHRDSDLFIPEHVFEGTTMFPGVMAIEAMSEAAALCIGNEKISAVKNIEFVKPIIIPDNDSTSLRICALADGSGIVKTVIKSESDGFINNNVEAEIVFNDVTEIPADIPDFCIIKDGTGINPESLFPTPLFQGKFFRRISEIKKQEMLDECVTEIIIPDCEKYFNGKFSNDIFTLSPAARDSFLQSGLIILPAGSLPEKIGEISFFSKPVPGEKVLCHVIVRKQNEDHCVSDLAVYDEKGKLIESIKNVMSKTPDKNAGITTPRVAKPVSVKRTQEDLDILINDAKWAIASVCHSDFSKVSRISKCGTKKDIKKLLATTSNPRKISAVCNLIAVRRAAVIFAEKYDKKINPDNISLGHNDSGKPQMKFADDSIENIFRGCDVSIADSANCSFAFIGQIPVGIDVEIVDSRNSEMWRALLHNDGYKLALNLTAQTGETFDISATRVWTLIEAAKKANELKRILPRFNSSLGDPWLSFSYADAKGTQEYLCVTANLENEKSPPIVFTISFGSKQYEKSQSDSPIDQFNFLLNDFSEKMSQFKPLFEDDPNSPDTEEHHKQFCEVINNLINQLDETGNKVDAGKLYQLRTELINNITPFLDESDVFKHAIDKPYGYAGDFLMLDKLVQETSQSKGIAYHFDRSQLEYPASVACRNRIKWVSEDIVDLLKPLKKNTIKILDIGIGAAPIERCLVKLLPDTKIILTAVDIEPAALEYVEKELKNTNSEVKTYRIDLRRDDAAEKIAEFAAEADVCIAVGIIEAQRDEEVINVLGSILKNAKPGTPFYTESFNPEHPTRPHMEWFMDFHLGYRTADEVKELVVKAGAKPENMKSYADATQSLDFLKVIV